MGLFASECHIESTRVAPRAGKYAASAAMNTSQEYETCEQQHIHTNDAEQQAGEGANQHHGKRGAESQPGELYS